MITFAVEMNLRELGASRSAVYGRLVRVKLRVKFLDVGLGAGVVLRAVIKGEKDYDFTIKEAIFIFQDIPHLGALKAALKSLLLLFSECTTPLTALFF